MLPSILTGLELTEKDVAAVERHRRLVSAIGERIKGKTNRFDLRWEDEAWNFSFPDGPSEDAYKNKELATTVARQLGAMQVSFDLHYRARQIFRQQADSYEQKGEIGEQWVMTRCPPISPSSPNWAFDAKIFQFRRPKSGEGPGVVFSDILELWLQAVRTSHLVYETAKIPVGGRMYRNVLTSRYGNTTSFPKGPGMINVP